MQVAVAPWLIPFSVAAVIYRSFVDYNPGAGRPVFGESTSETLRHAAHRLANRAVEVRYGSCLPSSRPPESDARKLFRS
jgi:hypothetical protein